MKKLITFLMILFLPSCGQKEPSPTTRELEAKIDSLNSTVELLRSQVSQHSVENFFKKVEKVAFLTVGTSEFQPIKTYIGTITVNIADIQPFANGSKATLVFGNPLYADLTKVKFQIDYGTLDKDSNIKEGSEKTKEVTVPQDIKGGSWNKVHVILEGLPTAELGYLRIHGFEAEQIRLINRN